ncbi:MAG: DUF418 domain-containing protein [Brevundimonas sp.]|nr:MAG: DUF418 domain-containing protein [Brevundimonas sp.]
MAADIEVIDQGRMALTGYLGSTFIGAFVWYGWGLGRIEDPAWLGMARINLFAVAVSSLCSGGRPPPDQIPAAFTASADSASGSPGSQATWPL